MTTLKTNAVRVAAWAMQRGLDARRLTTEEKDRAGKDLSLPTKAVEDAIGRWTTSFAEQPQRHAQPSLSGASARETPLSQTISYEGSALTKELDDEAAGPINPSTILKAGEVFVAGRKAGLLEKVSDANSKVGVTATFSMMATLGISAPVALPVLGVSLLVSELIRRLDGDALPDGEILEKELAPMVELYDRASSIDRAAIGILAGRCANAWGPYGLPTEPARALLNQLAARGAREPLSPDERSQAEAMTDAVLACSSLDAEGFEAAIAQLPDHVRESTRRVLFDAVRSRSKPEFLRDQFLMKIAPDVTGRIQTLEAALSAARGIFSPRSFGIDGNESTFLRLLAQLVPSEELAATANVRKRIADAVGGE